MPDSLTVAILKSMMKTMAEKEDKLQRSLGIFDATMMGLGSIIGTGVFVSIAIAAGYAGANVIFGVVLAALLALCNALSSAQLAAACPVSGGTYEYGYKYIHPYAGFIAGWLFLAAKSASAATAALGFAGYLCYSLGISDMLVIPIAVLACMTLTRLITRGIKRSSIANTIIVAVTLGSLLYFIFSGIGPAFNNGKSYLTFAFPQNFGAWHNFLNATALIFVAFTGYGRIATMGEEVHEPKLTIPLAILSALAISALIYIAVAVVAIGSTGSDALAGSVALTAAPLETAAVNFSRPAARYVIAIGAITAMLGVLLNLILGLSRVLLAMARRNDMPELLTEITPATGSPDKAVITIGFIITAIAAIGSIKLAWSFSAFTVLIYYAITNLAALRMPKAQRLYSPFFACTGLIGSLTLAFWIDPMIWFSGLILIALGLIWKTLINSNSAEK
ncbi:MAG: amino acid permease [Sedimentisphaerales bacterium]|nr:amino acid permease [Sedimentisphaerales bacterium]